MAHSAPRTVEAMRGALADARQEPYRTRRDEVLRDNGLHNVEVFIGCAAYTLYPEFHPAIPLAICA